MKQVAIRQGRVQLEGQAFEILVSRSGGNESSSLSFLHQNSKSDIAVNGQLGEMVEERLEKELLEGMESEGEEQNDGSLPEDFDVKQQEILLGASSYEESSQNSKKYDDYAESEISSSQGGGFKEVKRKIIHKDKREAIRRLQERQHIEIGSVKVEEDIDLRENENIQCPEIFESDRCNVTDKCKRLLEQTMKIKNKLHFLEIKQQVKRLYESGMRLSEISRKLEISPSILEKWINRQSRISKRKDDNPHQIKGKIFKGSQINKFEARKQYESGLSVRQISQKFNVSRQTLKNWLRPTNKMNRQQLVKEQQRGRQPTLKKEQKQKSQVRRRSSRKQHSYSEEAKERIVQQFHRQQNKNITDFALQMQISKSTLWRWVRDYQKRIFLNSFLQNQKQPKMILLESFQEGSVLEYKDIRKCMSLTNHKALEVPNSWVDSYINQYDLDSCFKIVKKIELKEENE